MARLEGFRPGYHGILIDDAARAAKKAEMEFALVAVAFLLTLAGAA